MHTYLQKDIHTYIKYTFINEDMGKDLQKDLYSFTKERHTKRLTDRQTDRNGIDKENPPSYIYIHTDVKNTQHAYILT